MTLSEQIIAHFSQHTAPGGLLGATFKLKDLINLGTTQELRPGIWLVWPQSLTWRFSPGADGAIAIAFTGPDYPTLTAPVPVIGTVQADVIGVSVTLTITHATFEFHFAAWPSFTIVLTLDN